MRRWLIVLAACSSPKAPPPDQAPAPPPTPARPKPAPAPIAKKPAPPPKPAITSMHGTSISIVAVVEDGGAAATADGLGNLRLWPTLDGTQEPFVVPGPIPVQLAVARDHDRDFAIAAIDQAGSMTIMRVDGEGRLRGKQQIGGDDPVLQIEATPHGFITLRQDQAIELVAFDGNRSRLPPPEHRVAQILYRNNRGVALYRVDGKVYGRWIDFAAGARWGEQLPEMSFDTAHAVLAPDHQHIVAVASDKLVAIDTKTGIAGTPFSGRGDPLGYVDATTIACSIDSGVVFYAEADGKKVGSVDLGFAADDTPAAVATGHLVAATAQSLAIVDTKQAHYLGYQIDVPKGVKATPVGLALSSSDTRWIVDKQFHMTTSIRVPHDEYTEVLDTLPLADGVTVALEGIDDQRWLQAVGHDKLLDNVRDDAIHFDPATRILGLASGGQTVFAKVDAAGKLGPRSQLVTSTSPLSQYLVDTTEDVDRVFLLDPALANGLVAMVVHDHRVYAIHGDDLAKPGKLKPHASFTVKERIVAIDRAGRMIIKVPGQKDLVIHGDTDIALPGTSDATRVLPSPDGKLIAVQGTRLSLYRNDGSLVWQVPANGVTGLTWFDGALVGAAQGVVKFDLATGDFGERQCGWRFGLYPKQPSTDPGKRLVCDA